jgi:micrococcal nuclease
MYEYKAIVTKVYDGDTITVDIDLGLHIWVHGEKIRLFGINTPEVRGEEREAGLVSRDRVRELIMGQTIILKTRKDKSGKYGRLLGEIFMDGVERSVNQILVDEGLAEEREY